MSTEADQGEGWAGLSLEGVRLSAVAVLRRFEGIAGGKRPVALLASDSIQPVLQEAARQAGWREAPPAEATAVLAWGSDGQIVLEDGIEWFCCVDREANGSLGLEPVKSVPFRGYLSISEVFGRLGRRLRLGKEAVSLFAHFWTAWGFDHRVGSKMALLRVPEVRETYWAKPGRVAANRRAGWREILCDGVATFGWIGHVPLAGALLASLVTAALAALSWPFLTASGIGVFRGVWAGVALASVIGCVLTESWAARRFLASDPREVVLDETAGMSVTLLFLPEALLDASGTTVAAYFGIAFIAFRLFDMVKIGIRWLERKKWRGVIVWDDVLAGVYAGAVTWLIARGFTFS